jgi:hypothetical protein
VGHGNVAGHPFGSREPAPGGAVGAFCLHFSPVGGTTVRPMIDREPPNAAETRGASVRTRFCKTSGLVRALGALPITLERRIVGFQKPPSGKSRLKRLREGADARILGLMAGPLGGAALAYIFRQDTRQ